MAAAGIIAGRDLTSQAASEPEVLKRRLSTLYEPIREELAGFEAILAAELQSASPFIDQLLKYGLHLGGKRLRPSLLLLAAKATGRLTSDHLLLATVIEMIHTATLLHDDVLDGAAIRRHGDTVNARWGDQTSVLLGDYLFTHSFHLASTLTGTFACQTIGRATNAVCEGELRQIASRGNFALTEEEYLGIIEAKTAELCACCCRLGAHYAGASPQEEESLARYGRYVGMAFQIADDLLDLLGDEATTGKSLGSDLAQHKPTLPLIRLLAQAPEHRQTVIALLARPDNHRPGALEPWFERTDALMYARQTAARYAQRAGAELNLLAASPARTALRQLTEFVIDRTE